MITYIALYCCSKNSLHIGVKGNTSEGFISIWSVYTLYRKMFKVFVVFSLGVGHTLTVTLPFYFTQLTHLIVYLWFWFSNYLHFQVELLFINFQNLLPNKINFNTCKRSIILYKENQYLPNY